MPRPRATLKRSPEDFLVDELPLYSPSGSGEHLYVHFKKRGLDSLEAVGRLARRLGTTPRDAGTAGLKDRAAVTTQWASFPFPLARAVPDPRSLSDDALEILSLARHPNKLRTGHLAGNRFTLTLRDLDPGSEEHVAAAFRALGARGLPNAFGAQRFGRGGDNPARALAWLRGESPPPRDPKLRRLLVSALQASLFNEVLARRQAEGSAHLVLAGDLAQLGDSHKLFLSTCPDTDSARAEAGEVSATGPLFGPKMRAPEGHPAELEAAVVAAHLGTLELLAPLARLAEGTRRPLWLRPKDLTAETTEASSVRLSFVLPRGAYATEVVAAVCDATEPPRAPHEVRADRPPPEIPEDPPA